jgi:chromosome segregation ATPase
MSWKIVAAALLALIVVVGISVFTTYKISYASGAASTVADCTTKISAQQSSYEAAQRAAAAKATKAQREADAEQIAQLRSQLATASQQSLRAQRAADSAKAQAASLNAILARLKNEDQDVGAWNDECLPAELLRSLHPNASRQAASRPCR